MWLHRVIKHLLAILGIMLLGGLLGATLVRVAPGFGVDEQELDTRLSEESVQSLRLSHEEGKNIFRFYGHYLASLFQGNLGISRSLGRPVAELLVDRTPVTFRSVVIGLIIGWLLGLTLAMPTSMYKSPIYELSSTFVSGIFLCLPSAALALLFLFIDGPGPLAIGLMIFPRVFRYAHNVFLQANSMAHIVAAKARGLRAFRVFWWHIMPPAVPQILALAGVSVSTAFGVAIPIEVICDSPGIGQLAWQAALARDLPLLVNLTLLVTLTTLLANLSSDLAIMACRAQQQ